MRKALIIVSALTSSAAVAQTAPAQKPKLIVAIAVDQLSSDVFSEYRGKVTGGFKRLAGGAVFPSGYQGHAATETCPGHSTILTGSRPSRTGIIANDWQDPKLPRPDKSGKPNYNIYCAEKPQGDASDFLAGGGYVVAPHFLRVPTLGDRMKAADPRSQVLSVAGKDRAAVMMGGHKADVTLWWNGKAFATYKGKETSIPASVAPISARATAEIAKPYLAALPVACRPLSRAVKLSDTLTLGTLQTRKAGNERGWRASSQSDQATLDAALAAMSTMKLGRGEATDLLAIGFSATDYVGHSTGTEGAEMCTQVHALDGILGQLFAALDKTGIPYAVTLTADHGGHDMPERNRANALPAAQRVDRMLSAMAVGTMVSKKLGLEGSALLGISPFGDMYLAPTIPADKRTAALEAAVSAYRAHPQVAAVFTKTELSAMPSPKGAVEDWSIAERFRASFDAERSGDFLVALKPFVTPIPDSSFGYVATHGSPWGYDRRVPIMFWWKGIQPFEQPNGVETVDIMPTLASLISLPVPAGEIDGRCLDLMPGEPSNCP